MGSFTYEHKDNKKSIYETYEWDNTWIEHANDTDKKRVFYIGDSISCGTRCIATAAAEQKILFDGFGTSKSIDNPYYKDSIALFARQLPSVDSILFNNGLHGWHLDEDEYEKYYDDMVGFLISHFNKKPYLLLTTAVRDESRLERVKLRNEAVKRIAEKYSLTVIDLYSVTYENIGDLSSDGVHPTESLYKRIASVILDSLNNL